MDSETLAHWQAADILFDQWLDLPPGEREAWLAAQTPPAAVRQRLDQLLAAHLQPLSSLDPGHDGLAGRRLGHWTLQEELGRGGMAVVHRAWSEQGMVRQQAAIKVLTLGALGVAGRDRFLREAAILARLNHSGITPLIDSGVADDGTCWLAMPLVDGERIDHWCEANAPDAHATVRMYLQVCDAVACAHRNLVIHRDLKPSNVLVDGSGHVRLLDFGIGQFTNAEDERTQTLWRALTPGYSAPEQLLGAPPSTAIDVYGLGALLHRLLTGHAPQNATEHNDTTRPSLLVRDAGNAYHRHYVPLKNDLDRVLLKALAEEPEQRYATAEALADDLRRWLEGRPVLAQKPKPGYRLRKFILRNRTAVAAGVLLALSLAGGIGATLWQANAAKRHAVLAEQQAALARQETEKARQRAHRAEAVRDFLGNMLITTRADDGGNARVGDIMAAAAAAARGAPLAGEPLTAADVLLLTGTVRFNLDDYDNSLADLRSALALLEPHKDEAPGELSRTHWELARHARRAGDHAAMLFHSREAVELNKLWDAPPNESFRARISYAEALLHNDRSAAEKAFRKLVTEIENSELKDSIRHINALNGLAIALAGPGRDPALRLPIQEERLRIARLIYGPDGGGLAFTLSDVTETFLQSGMLDRAEALARESITIADRSLQHPLMLRGMSRCSLGEVLRRRGRIAPALEAFEQGMALLRELDDNQLAIERCASGLAYVATASGRHALALDALSSSHKVLAANGRQQHPDAFKVCGLQASAQLRHGDHAAAGQTLQACAPPDTLDAPLPYLQARAEWLMETGDHAAAAAVLDSLRAKYAPNGQREWMRPWMLSLLLADIRHDAAMHDDLLTRLGDFARQSPLKECLATPGKSRCLALP